MNLNSLSPSVLNKIFSEWSLLTKLPTNKINDLIYRLEQMKEFGVDSFATRIVDKKGRSAMFCTHLFWPELIKDQKMKVQTAIQGDQVRVTGKKRDDLQEVIALLRGSNLELALQFDNFRD